MLRTDQKTFLHVGIVPAQTPNVRIRPVGKLRFKSAQHTYLTFSSVPLIDTVVFYQKPSYLILGLTSALTSPIPFVPEDVNL